MTYLIHAQGRVHGASQEGELLVDALIHDGAALDVDEAAASHIHEPDPVSGVTLPLHVEFAFAPVPVGNRRRATGLDGRSRKFADPLEGLDNLAPFHLDLLCVFDVLVVAAPAALEVGTGGLRPVG